MNFEHPFDLRFVSINGSIGPNGRTSGGKGTNVSGAYLGGDGRDQFYVLDSNLTGRTPLPPWTDEDFFYLPFVTFDNGKTADNGQFESETDTLGATLDCQVIDPKEMRIRKESGEPLIATTVQMGHLQAECSSDPYQQISDSLYLDGNIEPTCQNGPSALELVLTLDTQGNNTTLAEKKVCQGTVVLAWVRNPESSCKANLSSLDTENSLFLQCQPELVRGKFFRGCMLLLRCMLTSCLTGRASVRVDHKGRITQPSHISMPAQSLAAAESNDIFEDGPSDLIAQSNLYIFQGASPIWHNDTMATDFLNYFIRRVANDSQFLDPKRSVPTWELIQHPLRVAYASLFATWLGINKDQLLVPRSNTDIKPTKGWRIATEERIFLSTAMFSIALGILCTYALVLSHRGVHKR